MKDAKDFNLLIVDDEEAFRSNLAEYFKMDGYNVFTASGGREALEIIQNNNIDFVTSDIKMPDGGGDELIDKIAELQIKKPALVIITGFSDLTKEEAVAKGALDLLIKPMDIDLIDRLIKNQLNQ